MDKKNIESTADKISNLSGPVVVTSSIMLKAVGDGYSKIPIPFKILGIGDDGRAAFITEEGRLQKYNLAGITKNQLGVLANRKFWSLEWPLPKEKTEWDAAIDDVIRNSQRHDFIESNVRGRGAWRDGDKISYHDGIETIGEWDKKKLYLRLPRHENGINDDPIDPEITKNIKNTVFKMSFETPADAVRCLSWSILAPFAGALKYRPAMLLTGPSSSGKTTAANLCIRKLADCEWFNGSESTVPGVRGKIKYDSRGVMFEEAERDTLKKSVNRDELFSLMRVSVSDDAPDTVKGTKDGGYNSFKMQNMFGFIAIDPTLNSIADENRIFRINMVIPKNGNEWKQIEKELIELLCEKNCRAIRALTWLKLKTILELSDRIVDAVRKKTGRDYRSSYADSMLASTFMVIWTGTDNPSDEQIENMLDKYYSYQTPEEHRDEAKEIVDRILDEQIEILGDGAREKISIMECLNMIVIGSKYCGIGEAELSEITIMNYRQHVSRHGIRIIDNNNIAIANKHHMIMKIIGMGNGYSKILRRHQGYVEQKPVYFYDNKYRRCTILKGILETPEGGEVIPF